MQYEEIPQHISQFISRAIYNRSSFEVRQALIENARESFAALASPPDYEMFTSKLIRGVAGRIG